MQTLMTKVQEVEKKAAKLVAEASESGKRAVQAITESEYSVIAEAVTDAEKEAAARHKEKMAAARDEVNKLEKDHEAALQAVPALASKNADAALVLARSLFDESLTA